MSPDDMITQDMLDRAHRSADWFARKGWGDRDDMRSAAYWGVVRGVRSYREGEGTKLETWVNTCVYSELMTARKNRYRRECRAVPTQPTHGGIECERECNPLAAMIRREASSEFWTRATRGINNRDAVIVIAKYRDGTTMVEISRRLGISESRVSQIVASLQAHLAKNLKGVVYVAD